MAQGDFARAEPLLREALAIRRDGLRPGHRHIGDSLIELGTCLTALGRFDEAEAALLEARDIFDQGPDPDEGRRARAARGLEALGEARARAASRTTGQSAADTSGGRAPRSIPRSE